MNDLCCALMKQQHRGATNHLRLLTNRLRLFEGRAVLLSDAAALGSDGKGPSIIFIVGSVHIIFM